MLWKHLPDDQPLADLLCALDIAERHGTPINDPDSDGIQHARFELPIQLDPGLWFSSMERDEAERSWKRFRRYSDQYTLRDSDDPATYPGWKRFEEYASYVRTISLFAFDGPKWCDLWQELVPRLVERPILPYLQSVSLTAISTDELTTGTFLLMSPSVTTLQFAFNHDGSRIRSALPLAFDRTPSINTLRLSVLPWEGMHSHCHHLRRVSIIPQVEPRQLQYLAEFSDLRSLSISLDDTFSLIEELPLLKLDTLEAQGDWPCLTDLLSGTHAPNLRILSLEAWESGAPAQETAQYVTECLHAVSTKHPSLTRLMVVASYGGPPLLGSCIPQYIPVVHDTFSGPLLYVIQPLLALHGLCTLTLILPDYLDVDCSSTDLLTMSEAWCAIEELHIELWKYFAPMGVSPPGGDRPRGGPLAAVAHFARNCPSLKTLHLPPMDATELGLDDDLFLNDHPMHGLQRLITSKVKIGAQGDSGYGVSIASVVQFVEGIFPAAAWAFRRGSTAVADGWVAAHENSRCLDCRALQMPT